MTAYPYFTIFSKDGSNHCVRWLILILDCLPSVDSLLVTVSLYVVSQAQVPLYKTSLAARFSKMTEHSLDSSWSTRSFSLGLAGLPRSLHPVGEYSRRQEPSSVRLPTRQPLQLSRREGGEAKLEGRAVRMPAWVAIAVPTGYSEPKKHSHGTVSVGACRGSGAVPCRLDIKAGAGAGPRHCPLAQWWVPCAPGPAQAGPIPAPGGPTGRTGR